MLIKDEGKMLKIANDVNLKELERFGFENDSDGNYVWKNQYNVNCLMVNADTRELICRGDKTGNVILYDLIVSKIVIKEETN